MRNLKRNIIWLLPLLVLVSAPVWWPLAGQILKPRGSFESPQPPAISPLKRFVMEQVVMVQNRGDQEEFILEAARVNSGIHEDVLEMEDVEAQIFDKAGQATVLTGGEAFYNTVREIITVIDDVRVRTPEGRELRTDAVRYLARYRQVKTAAPVLLTDRDLQVSGENLSFDLTDGRLRIGGGVQVDLY